MSVSMASPSTRSYFWAMAPRRAVSCSDTPLVSMMSHLTGSSSLAFLMPRADASMKERSPNGLGVISAQVNFGAAAGASVAAGVAGAPPQEASTIDATAKRLKTYSKLFFISFSFVLLVGRNFSTIFAYVANHLLHIKRESCHRTTCTWIRSCGSCILERGNRFNQCAFGR